MMEKMPFGKYKGVLIIDLPDDYLRWLAEEADLHAGWLRNAVDSEFSYRNGFNQHRGGSSARSSGPMPAEVQTMAKELISAGFRKLASEHHPDKGGSTKTMQLVNRAMEELRKFLK